MYFRHHGYKPNVNFTKGHEALDMVHNFTAGKNVQNFTATYNLTRRDELRVLRQLHDDIDAIAAELQGAQSAMRRLEGESRAGSAFFDAEDEGGKEKRGGAPGHNSDRAHRADEPEDRLLATQQEARDASNLRRWQQIDGKRDQHSLQP